VISLVVADDQAMVRAGLRMVLEAEPDLRVVGEAADGEEAVAVVRRCAPDVVLMDIRMPRVDGIEAARRLLEAGSRARVLMLTTFNEDDYLYAALRAGTSGFLLKEAPPEQLVDAVRVVAAGDALLAPAVTRRVIEEFARSASPSTPPPALAELTAREVEVLGLLGRGLSNAEIAAELIISEATAKTHVGRILMKLGLRDRAQAVVFAYESGVVRPGTSGTR
jgi:DNA-binding NarL/FixJ family response regulator